MILSDICEFIVDCPHSTAPDEGAGYPLVRTPNIGNDRMIKLQILGVANNTKRRECT